MSETQERQVLKYLIFFDFAYRPEDRSCPQRHDGVLGNEFAHDVAFRSRVEPSLMQRGNTSDKQLDCKRNEYGNTYLHVVKQGWIDARDNF